MTSLRQRPTAPATAPATAPVGAEAPVRPRRMPIERIPQPTEGRMRATWVQADPQRIAAALATAQSRDPGGWMVVAASSDVPATTSVARTVAGREIVLWRDERGSLVAGPGACPHLGALLDHCPVVDGALRCRWHGLPLPADGARTRRWSWLPFPAFDDGVLAWVQLPAVDGHLDGHLGGSDETAGAAGQSPDRPRLTARPPLTDSVAAVIERVGICEPEDIIANRLDPWHGSWFHPYAFSHLTVDDAASDDERLVVDVTFRLTRTWGVPVRAEFACPDARTIVMTIVGGEGAGSVVETHATPLGPAADGRPRTLMTEATIAYSDRRGFRVARAMAPLLQRGMRRSAGQLWVDDIAYAERRYALRARGDTF